MSGASKRLTEAITVLKELGLPKEQQNERSALCLLALLNVTPDKTWSQATNPLLGITPIMDWARKHYKKDYAPNSRETFRRFSMHQFVQAAIALYNSDNPKRPVNSPKAVYQIEPEALKLLKSFGTPAWKANLANYRVKVPSLTAQYAKEREQERIAVQIDQNQEFKLSPGEHSDLIKKIIEDFGARYVPGGILLYAGDTGEKWGYFNEAKLKALGVEVDSHGKMPDVILYDHKQDWLFLIEAVTSHGPVDAKRHAELAALFAKATPDLVFVTAFPSRATMGGYLGTIAWETEVWVADSPSHLIHFDGKRFLGPYP